MTASDPKADRPSVYHGCVFCRSGQEAEVIRQMGLLFPEVRAIAPVKTRLRRAGGTVKEERVTLLPGYVFFEAGEDLPMRRITRADSVLRLLTYNDGDWRLHGYDDQFAGMLFKANGVIGLSTAFFDEGDRIRIVDGFLKEHEGSIVRVNRRARTAQIRISLQDKQISIWLGYELMERAERT